jgi:hypothetical protein
VPHAGFQEGAGLPDAGVPERLEQGLEEDLAFALLVAGQVLAAVADELAQGGGEVRAHGSVRARTRHVGRSQTQ